MAIKLDDLLRDAVASPPTLYLKLQNAIKDPDTTYGEFADIISADIAFAARLLRIVNSSFYSFSSRIDSISHAVNIVGTDRLADLALAALVIEKFKGIPADLIKMNSFWKHSIGCGLAAKIIAQHKKMTRIERYYLGGLLHDIGSLLLYKEAPVVSRMLLSEAGQDQKNLFAVEKEHLGFDHAEVGGTLLERWGLPEILSNSAKFHHNPMNGENHSLAVSIIHVADIIAHEMDLGSSGEPLAPHLAPDILDDIGLSQSDLDIFKDEINKQFGETVEVFLA